MTSLLTSLRHIPEAIKKNNFFPSAQKFLKVLLVVDCFFILLHISTFFISLPTEETLNLRLDMDFGYAEMFQYFQFCITALLLIALFARQTKGIYIIWALFFFVLFLDDAFRFHEVFGAQIANYFEIQGAMGLKAKDFGELAIAAFLGALFVLPFFHALFLGEKKAREVTLHLGILVAILLTFGIGIDMLHSFSRNYSWAGALTVIEDAGEMFAGSLMVCYVICLHIRQAEIVKKQADKIIPVEKFLTRIMTKRSNI